MRFWRPQAVERIFVSSVETCYKIGSMDAPFRPRILDRELTDSEVAKLRLSSFSRQECDHYATSSFGTELVAAVLENTLSELIPRGTIRKKTIHGRTTPHLNEHGIL